MQTLQHVYRLFTDVYESVCVHARALVCAGRFLDTSLVQLPHFFGLHYFMCTLFMYVKKFGELKRDLVSFGILTNFIIDHLIKI